jgi:predicted outer membrane repeat protein
MGEQGINLEGVEIRDSRFVGNYTDYDGAGVFAASVNGDVLIAGCVFEGNTAVYGGGAVSTSGWAITIEGSVFSNNWSTSPAHIGGAVKTYDDTILENNTFFGNGQALVSVGGAAIAFRGGASELRNNIVASSQGGAAIVVTSGSVTSSCNVFWENEGGIGDGYTPGPTDREVNPLFCDPENEDLSLAENSPCLPPQSGACGLIGALGRGCGAISVESRSWGRIKDLYR